MTVKAANNSTGPDGLVPTLLVFGVFLRMTELNDSALIISQRATIIQRAIEEITKIRAKLQVNNTLNTQNRPSTELIYDLIINSNVLV